MGLEKTIRNAVAAAAAAVGDLLADVVHEPFASENSDGLRTYGSAVTRKAFVETNTRHAVQLGGLIVVPGPTVLFVGNIAIDVRDRLTLPDGSQPPIVSVDGVADPAGGMYTTQVRCGRR